MRPLLFIPLLFLFACSKSGITEKNIVGEWKTTECDIELYEMNETMEAIVQKMALSMVYHINEDGSWTSTMESGERQTGTWILNEDQEELILSSTSSEYRQTWVYKNDFEFEYLFENDYCKERRIITKK